MSNKNSTNINSVLDRSAINPSPTMTALDTVLNRSRNIWLRDRF